MRFSFTILGEPASKSNSRRLVMFGRGPKARPAIIKSAKALNYVESFRWQCPRPTRMLEGDLAVSLIIFYASRRPDPISGIEIVLDAMQNLLYANDRQVKRLLFDWGLDPARPRAEITIGPLQGELAV